MSDRKRLRHEQILVTLHGGAPLRVAELAKRFDVSTETIRRDLDELTRQARLERTYGGATRRFDPEPGIAVRRDLYVAERDRIAQAATTVVADGQMLMIGSGATTVRVARRIAAERGDLTVLVHSHGVAAALSTNPTIKVIMAPGSYVGAEGAVAGAFTLSFLEKFNADLAIIGASGLSTAGANEALLEMGAVYSLMGDRCGATMIVADNSKMNRLARVRFRSWSEIDYLVTDQKLTGDVALAATAIRQNVMVADPDE